MSIIEMIKAFVIGIVEGITEWLPVSSTGHMILLNEFIKLDVSPEFWELFEVVIQFGAILAVIILFWKKIFPFSFKKDTPFVRMDVVSTWLKVIVAVIPAAVIGIPLDDWREAHLSGYKVVAVALIVYGIVFLFLGRHGKHESYRINDLSQLDYKTAIGIGFFQVLSLIPGTSRSGSTIIGAMLLGTSRTVAGEFTFWMAIPVMLGASLIKFLKFGFDFTKSELAILAVGCATAFFVSLAAVRFMLNYVKTHDFKAFGWYRIILGGLVLAYFLLF